jgi:biopolymer transport protein ExbD
MAFKPSAAKKHKQDQEAVLNMNSLMDMLTIMLLFLLTSFSTSGALATASEGLQPPRIVTKNKPKKAVVVGISKYHVFFNKEPIVEVEKVLAQKNTFLIAELAERLEAEATKAQDLEDRFGIAWNRELLVFGDKEVPFNVLLKVVVTCGRNQFSNLRLMGNLAAKQDIIQ